MFYSDQQDRALILHYLLLICCPRGWAYAQNFNRRYSRFGGLKMIHTMYHWH